MTVDNTPRPETSKERDSHAGVKRPDQGGTSQPGQAPVGPASGGDGAKGAGGPDGFGAGS